MYTFLYTPGWIDWGKTFAAVQQ